MHAGLRIAIIVIATLAGFAVPWLMIGQGSFRDVMASCIGAPGVAAITGTLASFAFARRSMYGLAVIGLGAGLVATTLAILDAQPFGVCLIIGMFAPGGAAVAGGLVGWLIERRRAQP